MDTSVSRTIEEMATPETILREINTLRTNPPGYAAVLERLRQHIGADNIYRAPGGARKRKMHEGLVALDEAIEFLRSAAGSQPLVSVDGMERSAVDHLQDLVSNNQTGHVGSDGSRTADRVQRYGSWDTAVGELMTYLDCTAATIVAQLLMCDGDSSRHNRSTLLSAEFNVCGVAFSSEHPSQGAVCVVTLAGGFGPKIEGETFQAVHGEPIPAQMDSALDNLPQEVRQSVEEALLVAGNRVQLVQGPSSATVTITSVDGEVQEMQFSWAAVEDTA